MSRKPSKRVIKVALLPSDPFVSAKIAGLRYVRDGGDGIHRSRSGKGFSYRLTSGKAVRDAAVLNRIRSLVIPPAWAKVWISPLATGHLQAVGVDARGRKQYRYHPLYRQIRDATKFTRMVAFGTVLPKIRRQVAEDLTLSDLPKRKVVASVVRLLESTCIRIGNDEYRKQNESFGLTTLRNRHVQIHGRTIRFRFKGKSGQEHDVECTDRKLARVLADCQDLPGYELFQYVGEDGEVYRICSDDVNEYLREVSGDDFTAKDFRTWKGSCEMALALERIGPAKSESESKRNIVAAIKETAGRLGNRPATCRKYYIHPAVIDGYNDETLFSTLSSAAARRGPHGLAREEVALMQLVALHKPSAKLSARVRSTELSMVTVPA